MYRDAVAQCPRCQVDLEYQGDVAGCRGCGGVLLSEAKLDEMLREMHDQPVAPVFAPRDGAATLPCARCEVPMRAVSLQGVEVDRCEAGHGVWFDTRELEASLRAAAEADVEAPRTEGVPSVRIGLGRAILGAFGSFLKTLGYGVVGTAGAVAGGAVIAAGGTPSGRWRRR